MMDTKALLAEFSLHLEQMSDDDVRASIQKAERLTAKCAGEVGDIDEPGIFEFCETESQSIPNHGIKCPDYSFISSYLSTSFDSALTWVWTEVPAA